MSSSCLFGEVLAGDNLVNESSENSHHGGTAIVKLGILLADFFLWLSIPVVKSSKPDSIVSREIRSGPPSELYKSAEEDDLGKTSWGNLEKSSNTGVDVGEFKSSGGGKVSVENPLVVVNESSGHGHHCDTTVLALNGTVTSEGLLVSDVSKGIKVSKRGNSTNSRFKLRCLEGRGAGSL